MEKRVVWTRGPFRIEVLGVSDYAKWFVVWDVGNGSPEFIHQEGFRTEDVHHFRANALGPMTTKLGLAPESEPIVADRAPTPFEYACATAMQYAEILELVWRTVGTMPLPDTLMGGFQSVIVNKENGASE